jgi:two-component system chemotaxis response regulator CheY
VPQSRILLVDDSKTMRHLLRAYLMGNEYEFLEAASGAEALEVLEGNLIDVVISDVRMADIDGIELVRTIRRREPLGRRVATVLISGDRSPNIRARALIAGADEFLEKPLEPRRLQRVVTYLLKR